MTEKSSPLGDRIRKIATQLDREKKKQIKAAANILAAAAQLAINEENLITDVAEMVEQDLAATQSQIQTPSHTANSLKIQFETLKAAKLHFGFKARSWEGLAQKLNTQPSQTLSDSPLKNSSKTDALLNINHDCLTRLDLIETQLTELSNEVRALSAILRQHLG